MRGVEGEIPVPKVRKPPPCANLSPRHGFIVRRDGERDQHMERADPREGLAEKFFRLSDGDAVLILNEIQPTSVRRADVNVEAAEATTGPVDGAEVEAPASV